MQDFDIGIWYQTDVPEEAINELVSELVKSGLTVQSRERPVGVYAAFEWAVSTIVVAYIAKPYFEGFLNEAGKDSYITLKSGILKLIERLFGPKPEAREARRSIIFSIQIRDHQERSVKCIFPEGVSHEHYALILDHLHELLVEDAKTGNGALNDMLSEVKGFGGSHYIEYSLTQNMWVAIDTQQEIQERASKNH